jgi:hypothetical protein
MVHSCSSLSMSLSNIGLVVPISHVDTLLLQLFLLVIKSEQGLFVI